MVLLQRYKDRINTRHSSKSMYISISGGSLLGMGKRPDPRTRTGTCVQEPDLCPAAAELEMTSETSCLTCGGKHPPCCPRPPDPKLPEVQCDVDVELPFL